MDEIGRVVAIDNDKIIIQLESSASCSDCNSCSVGHDDKVRYLTLNNDINAEINDRVELEINPSMSILASVILYLFPILMMIAGYLIGDTIEVSNRSLRGDSEIAIFVSIGFLILSFIIIHFSDKYFKRLNIMTPKVMKLYKSHTITLDDL